MNPAVEQSCVSPAVAEEVSRCQDPAGLAEYLKRHPDLLHPKAVEDLAELVRQRVRLDIDAAFRLADAALALATELGDSESLGRGYRAKANALWYKGNLKAAVALFDEAVTHFERANRQPEIGRTLSSCIQPLALLGDYDRATQAAERAQGIFLAHNDSWRLARLSINVANIKHRQDRFAEALTAYQHAYEQLIPHKDVEGMAAALHNMSVCLIMLNDFDQALEIYRRAREVCEQNDMPLVAAQADYNMAYLYFLRGDYETANRQLRVTREACRQNGDAQHAALCDLDQSELYLELNLPEEAAEMACEAEQSFQTLGMQYELGRSVVNQAIARHQQRDPGGALELFRRAEEIFARERNQAWQALTDLYRALVLFETGQTLAATELCSQALGFFETAGLDRRAMVCRLLQARLSHAGGRLEEAQFHCRTALRGLRTLEAPLLSYQAYVLLGHAQGASGDVGSCYKTLRKARLELESLRSSLQGEELKIAFMKNKLDVYESLVKICLGRDKRSAGEIFIYMEQAKSRSLMEMMFGRGNPLPARATALSDTDRIAALRRELNWYYRRIEIEQTRADISPADIKSLRTEARKREDQLLRALRDLPQAGEYETISRPIRALTLSQIREALHPRATLVEYFQAGPEIVAAALTREKLSVVRVGPADRIASCLHMLDFQLSRSVSGRVASGSVEEQILAATVSRLKELYQLVIAPLANALHGEHLIIVPHGVLHYVPFHALMDGNEYLIDRFSFSYAPSASTLAMCQRRPANSNSYSLLMGVPDERAPWIRQEIRSVANAVPLPKVYLGAKATETTLRNDGPRARLIHIATHGVFRRDNPMFSSVRLGDSYLNLYDLYQLRLPVELLALSGCGTGLNVVAAGDELLGLMRGLLLAGSQCLLLTLWDVHDRTTAEFMAYFYALLQKHPDKAAALRHTMREFRKRRPHPFYWAPFVLVGKVC